MLDFSGMKPVLPDAEMPTAGPALPSLSESSLSMRSIAASNDAMREAGQLRRAESSAADQFVTPVSDTALAVSQRGEEFISSINTDRPYDARGFYQYRREFSQEITALYKEGVDTMWERSYVNASLPYLQQNVGTTRQTLASMSDSAMSEIMTGLPVETQLRAAYLLSWPIRGITVNESHKELAGDIMSGISENIHNRFTEQRADIARLNNLSSALDSDPQLARYSSTQLSQSEEIRKEFLTRVSELTAFHHGMVAPALAFFSDPEREQGAVAKLDHAINFNTDYSKYPESELIGAMMRNAIHETRHTFQNAIIYSCFSPNSAETQSRLLAPLVMDETLNQLAMAYLVEGRFLYSQPGDIRESYSRYRDNVVERDASYAAEMGTPDRIRFPE